MTRENIKRMQQVADANGCTLRPHIKTHKMAQMLKIQLSMGIHRFKCATCQELRLACESGATDCLWAYPVVGPNV